MLDTSQKQFKKKVFTDFPPDTERADRPVVNDPSKTCSPMATFKAYPVHLAFAAYLSLSMIAASRVGRRRSATVCLISLISLIECDMLNKFKGFKD